MEMQQWIIFSIVEV